jgi:hypothetical protein
MLNVLNVDEAIKQMLYGAIVLVLAWVYVRTARAGTGETRGHQ